MPEILTMTEQTPLASGASNIARIYRDLVHREAVRVIGLMDRERFSPTCGCMDRTHWAWKFTDFPGARFQEGLCALSFLHATEFDGNQYYHCPKLLDWIAVGFDYWASIQYADGSFDEAYPYERSLAATAFTGFYLSEAWNFLDGCLPAATATRFKASLAKAADWLVRNDETHGFLSNHLAAAAAALYHAWRITGEERFEERSRYFVDRILAHQSSEGWYDEYGGADPGYQTHGSFYLARIWELSGDNRLLDSLARATAFQAHFVHPDGSLGGEYTSRNTQTYYPAAFEMLSRADGSARWIADTMRPSVESSAAAGLAAVDAYNYFPLMNNCVFAARAATHAEHMAAKPTLPQSGAKQFPKAGLLKVEHGRYTLYVGLHKGGALKAFDRQRSRLIATDCGYIGRLTNGKLLSSQALDNDRPIEIAENRITIRGSFYGIKKPVMKPIPFLCFRAFSLTAGRFKPISRWLKSLLVKVLIYRKRALDLRFVRTIDLRDDGFTVRDKIQGGIGPQIAELRWQDVFTTIHMGSSRYFVPHELIDTAPAGATEPIDPNRLSTGVTRERTYETK